MRDAPLALALDVPHLDTPAARDRLRAQAAYFLRQPSPALLAANAAGLVLARAVVGAFTPLDAAVFVATAAAWPLQEWLFHKVLLHARPRRVFGVVFDPVYARTHRAHHRRPWLVDRTLLPPPLVLALIPTQIAAWVVALPTVPLALTAAATYAASALLYEWTHYLAHAHYVPRSAYFRRIRRNHLRHHFKNEAYWYSFTVPHVDAWFGTDPADAPPSETARTLGVDDVE